jgi:tRNA(fMet)-specific endonuclease VapC
MLDSDICIYVGKSKPPKLADRFERLADRICISAITLAELHFGAENSDRRLASLKTLGEFVDRLVVLPFSANAASHFGQLRVELQRSGRPIGPYDMLVAAHARAEGLILVTNNEREFRRVPGLLMENWV